MNFIRAVLGFGSIGLSVLVVGSGCGSTTSPSRSAPDGSASGGSPNAGGTSGTSGASGGTPSAGGTGGLDGSAGGTSGSGGVSGASGTSGSGGSSPRTPDAAVGDHDATAPDANGGTRNTIGGSCTSDRDCKSGLICVSPASNAFGAGGPPNGMCTADCSRDSAACTLFDAICITVNANTAYCFEGCTVGSSDPNKCGGRLDSACVESVDSGGNPVAGSDFCDPTCATDADCKGRKCDLGTGLCVDVTSGSGVLPLGAECDPNLTPDHCKGACITFQGGVSLCSGVCSLGTIGCDQDQSNPTPSVACDIPGSATATTGDSGYCATLCDCDGDCLYPGFVCEPFPQIAEAYGREGQCVPPTGDSGVAVSHIPCQ